MFSKDSLNEEAKYELNKSLEIENKNNRVNLIFEASNKKKDKTYNLQKLKQQDLLEEKFIMIIYH